MSLDAVDRDTVHQAFLNGAFFIFLDPPKLMDFGVDGAYWRIGPRFAGLKMIPPGPHLLTWKYHFHLYIYIFNGM